MQNGRELNNADIYHLYKPFRNYLRHFPLVESLQLIWLYHQNLIYNAPLPSSLDFRDRWGQPLKLKNHVFAWELDILARELVLNASAKGKYSLSKWEDLRRAFNFIKDIENEIAELRSGANVLRDLYCLIHHQFPWQRPLNKQSMVRYYLIFGYPDLDKIIERETGLTTKQFYQLGLAVSGYFLNKSGMSIFQDYSILGINNQQRDVFFKRMTTDMDSLRKKTQESQTYDALWSYSWNPQRATPLISFDTNSPEQIICPLPMHLMRKITDGLYYDIVGKDGFQNAYGPAYQEYVGKVLKTIFSSPKFEILPEKEYFVGKNRKHGSDWLLQDEAGSLFIECKAKRLPQAAKFDLGDEVLANELETMAKYIVQNYKNINDAIAGHTSWESGGSQVFSIIITLEDWWIFNTAINQIIDDKVKELLDKENIDVKILEEIPYFIASIAEMESAFQTIEAVGIVPFFQNKRQLQYREWAISTFSSSFYKDISRKKLFAKEWLQIQKQIVPAQSQS